MAETVDDIWDDTPEGAPIRFGSRKAVDLHAVRQTHQYKQLWKSFRFECETKRNEDGSVGAVCWLCGMDIDYRLRHPHPFAWSMDHVITAQEAPERMLDRRNVAASHSDCNLRRGTSEPSLHLGVPSEVWASVLVLVLCMVNYSHDAARALLGQG